MSDNRPNVYIEDEGPHAGKVVYRSSSFGNCIKELAAIRAGVSPAPFPARFSKAFADGNRGEDTIISMLTDRGFVITDAQREINWEILPGVIIRGHIDGLARYLGGDPELVAWISPEEQAIFDAKTTTKKYGIAPHLQVKYDWQLSIYGHALGVSKTLLGVGTKAEDGSGDVVTVDTHTTDTLPFTVSQIKARVAKIESLAKQVEAADDFDLALRNLTCDTENRYPCGVYWLHDDEKPVVVRQESTDEILDGILSEYDAARQDEAEAKALKEDAKARLIAHIGGRVDKTGSEFAVTWTGTGLKKELDKRALEKFLAAHSKTLDEFYGTVSADKSINVKRVGV